MKNHMKMVRKSENKIIIYRKLSGNIEKNYQRYKIKSFSCFKRQIRKAEKILKTFKWLKIC